MLSAEKIERSWNQADATGGNPLSKMELLLIERSGPCRHQTYS